MYAKILVGTDGSDTATKAVARAVDVAASHGSSLTIFTAGRKDRGEKVVAEEAARHEGAGVELTTKVVDTDPVSGLLTEATDGGYDLLVMGNKGMTGVTRFFKLGNVPNKVTHNLPCSLLIVKTT
jgi:nucleotide-binding universal stress UspA family protein